jgi:hypothetical protein
VGGIVGAICTAAQACVGGNCQALATKTVFVTSTTYDGATIGSLANADVLCQGRATAGGRLGTYKAFLSDDTTSAAARLTHATVPYTLVDGTIVANNWAGLMSFSLIAAINMSEFGAAAPAGALCGASANVYTGTFPNGNTATGDTCSNWTSNAAFADVGESDLTNGAWAALCAVQCNNVAALYCVQQ